MISKESLELQLKEKSLDLVDLIPIPAHGDRIVRLRTLEELISEFEGEGDGAMSYLIAVRPARPEAKAAPAEPAPPEPSLETASAIASAYGEPDAQAEPRAARAMPAALPASSKAQRRPAGAGEHLYLGDGKLNLPYLDRNAELLFNAGEFALARNVYRTILQSGERTAHALAGMARCFEAEGRATDACAHYEESITYHPSLDCYRRLAALLLQQENPLLAADALERALNLKDISPEVRYDLHKAAGNCYTRVGRVTQAERHYKACLAIDPSADEIRSSQGALYLQAGRTADAQRSFLDAISANPSNAKALMGLGSCALATGDKREAHDYFARSLELELNNPTAIFYLVKCAYEIKSYATAARLVEEFMDVAPVDKNLLYSLAGLQFHLGRLQEASSTARRILGLVPDHAGAAELLRMVERAMQGPTTNAGT